MKMFRYSFSLLLLAAMSLPAFADEREVTPEQLEAIQKGGEVEAAVERPKNLPDLTKGEPLPPAKDKPQPWHLGPTGISCIMVGGFTGDQLLVQGSIKGSPAEGKILPGDVITGINGVKFQPGGHLGETIGNAIVEAEKEEKGGKIVFQVWRDKNYIARAGSKNVTGTDIDVLINQAQNDNSLYDWKPEEARKQEVANMDLAKFPIDPSTLDLELHLRVFPAYTDTAPFNCPKTTQILEDAWKVLEKRFIADPKNPQSGKGGVIEAMALIASGKPEHRKLVHDWVRTKNCPWQPPTDPIGAMFEPGYKGYKGYQSWHHGFIGLNCALYYDATGDDYVLPALRKYAIETAMGQSKSGSWGHTFAFPDFNGGQLHMMNPGYGALNAAGNRCFFLIALAQKLGVKHPEIDLAVKRAHQFFGSYVDQGAIPYGDHGAAGTDDSNGKNTGIAFAMKLLGDDYGAKYFAMMSSHCAFTRRGGHAHDYHGEWSSWAAGLCGPQVRAYNERNLRWRRTLCRMYDGSFVYHSPTEKYGTLRDPTATEVFHQAIYLKQTLITGKDANESYYPSEREMKQLLASASGQFNNSYLKELAGKPWMERSTDEIFDLLDIFIPKTRKAVATELGKRFKAGESAIVPRLVALLTHESARYRHGALCALAASGDDVMLSNLSKIVPLLNDPMDFVRIAAVEAVSKATDDKEAQVALLKTTVGDGTAIAPNSVRNAVQTTLFASKAALSTSPFKAGLDESLVQQALSDVIVEETGGGPLVGSKINVWDKDTVIRLAGPLTYIAEEEQVFDQMFGSRNTPAQAMLSKFGYLEGAQTTGYRIRKKAAIPRSIRAESGFKDPLIKPDVVAKQPGAFTDLTDDIKTILMANPLEVIEVKDDSTNWKPVTTPLVRILKTIEDNKKPTSLPSIADDVASLFQAQLDATKESATKIKVCRDALANPAQKNTFEKIAAMNHLVEMLGSDALGDLLPYLGNDYWRLRDHSRTLASGLVRSGAGPALAALFAQQKSPDTLAGILSVFATAKHASALDLAKKAMQHESPKVRGQATETVAILGGNTALTDILAFMKSATHREDFQGLETALEPACLDPATAAKIRDAVIAQLPGATASRPTLFYLLARIGDPTSFDTLRKLAQKDDPAVLSEIAAALSYSPHREADKLMLELASAGKARAAIVAKQAVRRMVIGPKGFGDILPAQALDFAEAMLKLSLDRNIIGYLGYVNEARALQLLMYCLENGHAGAAESLVTNAENLEKLTPEDSKIATKAIQGIIEYIEITRLRGGPKAHMDKDDHYTEWKALQARAGKVLLKVHKPDKAPIPGLDSLDLE